MCMEARSADDPNREVLDELARDLAAATDAKGRRLEVVRIPSPGLLRDEIGAVDARELRELLHRERGGDRAALRKPFDDDAVKELARCFPDRKVIGRPSRAILRGGGSFHCMTQQEPV